MSLHKHSSLSSRLGGYAAAATAMTALAPHAEAALTVVSNRPVTISPTVGTQSCAPVDLDADGEGDVNACFSVFRGYYGTATHPKLGQLSNSALLKRAQDGAWLEAGQSYWQKNPIEGKLYAVRFKGSDQSLMVGWAKIEVASDKNSATVAQWAYRPATEGGVHAGDATAPTLTAPVISDIVATGATLTVQSSEAGKVYYAVLPADASAPSVADVVTGTGALTAGKDDVIAATDKPLTIAGLADNKSYKVYVVAEDASGNQGSVASVDLVIPDFTAPVLGSLVFTDNYAIAAQSNEEGTLYYVVQPASAAAPTTQEAIKNGTVFAGSLFLNTENLSLVQPSWSFAAGDYTFYYFTEDAAGNQSAISLKSFTYQNAAPQILDSSFTLSGGRLDVALTPDEDCDMYVLVDLKSNAVMTGSAVVDSINQYTGFGSESIYALEEKTIPVSGLYGNTSYRFYAVFVDYNKKMTTVIHEFTTGVVALPVLSNVAVTAPSATGAKLAFTTSLGAEVYYVVRKATDAAPDAEAIVDGDGTSADNTKLSAGKSTTLAISGLVAKTNYKVYLVALDGDGRFGGITTVAFATTATSGVLSTPVFASDKPVSYRVLSLDGQEVRNGELAAGQSVQSIGGLQRGSYVVQLRQGPLSATQNLAVME